MIPRPILVLAIAVGIVSAASGCGGDESHAQPTPAAFKAAAIKVCAASYKKAYELPPPIGMKQLYAYPAKQQAIREQELRGLRAVQPSPNLSDEYHRYLADLAALDRLYAQAIHGIAAKTSAGTEALIKRGPKLDAKVRADEKALGLSACAKDPYSATHSG